MTQIVLFVGAAAFNALVMLSTTPDTIALLECLGSLTFILLSIALLMVPNPVVKNNCAKPNQPSEVPAMERGN